jgi:2-polyprenyl-3-methyl-5-hydroxy-6-metoxy-1,4-benzoquinol methylase
MQNDFRNPGKDSVRDNYLDPEVAARYDRERFGSLVGRIFDRLEKRALGRALAAVTAEEPAPRTLDVPCGTGRITEWLLDQGLEVTGADVSPAMLERARARCAPYGTRASFVELDLERPVDIGSPCDLVTCIRLFHHLDSPARARILASLAKLTRRHVIVNVSYSNWFYEGRRKVKRWLRQGVSAARSTEADIVRELACSGLVEQARFFLLPGASEDLILLLRKSDGADAAAGWEAR